MLLYDRVRRQAQAHLATPQDLTCYESLRAAQVFDIRQVVPLFQDWERDRHLPMPKRPPYANLWGEWTYEETSADGKEKWAFDLGCLLHLLTPEDMTNLRRVMLPAANDWGPVFRHGPVREDFWSCDEFYLGERFSYMTQCIGSQARMLLRRLTWGLGYIVFGMRQGSTEVRTTAIMPPRAWLERGQKGDPTLTPHQRGLIARFGLMTDLAIYQETYNPQVVPWPLLMACALLHCRNIVQETVAPPPKLARKHARHGHPPLSTYKVLRVAVPHEHQGLSGVSAIPSEQGSMRLHLCRGHFKLLQHARFKNPGWHWWPAHWRGDPALGRVEKDYALEPTAAGQASA